MHMPNRKPRPPFRGTALSLLATFAVIIAASPAAATTDLAGLDRGALALILAFGSLLFAIVFEVWRQTLRNHALARTAQNRKHGYQG